MKRIETISKGALAQLPVFIAVAERRSFTGASRDLAMSPSAVSQSIARLEQELGMALFLRTTRSVELTDAGARLLAEAGPPLALATEALEAIKNVSDEPSGVLRLNVPRVACHFALPQVLSTLARRHPKVRVEVVVNNDLVDIVSAGFDAGVRLKQAVHDDMVRVRLSSPLRQVVVGSSEYLSRHGRPSHPRELAGHACLGWRSFTGSGVHKWTFVEGGREFEVQVRGPVFSNDAALLTSCAEQHLGLALVSEPEVQTELASRSLETVLDEYALELPGLFLYFPRHARGLPKIRALIACVNEELGA